MKIHNTTLKYFISIIVFPGVLTGLILYFVLGRNRECSNTNPCSFDDTTKRSGLKHPQQLLSKEGSLNFTLHVDVANISYEWLSIRRRMFNKTIPGPTWRIKPGDQVTVTLKNNLKTPQKEESPNQFRFPNSTNIHVHGLHISSQSPQDNVFIHVPPGGDFTYRYQIDADQPAGTYWYHPHVHGSTMFQVSSGMAGMIVVEDPTNGTYAAPDHLAAVSCPNNCEHDVQLVFQPALIYSGNNGFANLQQRIEDDALFRNENIESWLQSNVNIFTTNGLIYPRLDITAGQTKRFRMVNAGGDESLEINVIDPSTGSSACSVLEIAIDGVYLDAGRTPKFRKSFLVPSARTDWLIVCNTPGTFELRSSPSNTDTVSIGNFDRYNNLLLTLNVTGSQASTTLETSLPPRQSFISDFQNVSQENISGYFAVETAPGTNLNREKFQSETDYRYQAHVDTIQEWHLISTDPASSHPIHIHVNHFQVVSYNDYNGPVGRNVGGSLRFFSQDGEFCEINPNQDQGGGDGPDINPDFLEHRERWLADGEGTLGYAQAGEFRDVLLVPPLANITIRFMAHKFMGEVVMHCHILAHEDSGMMLTTEIVNQSTILNNSALVKSPLGYPGQCRECDPFPFNSFTNCSKLNSSSSKISPLRYVISLLCFVVLMLVAYQI